MRVHTNVSQSQPRVTGGHELIQRPRRGGKRTSTRSSPGVKHHSCLQCKNTSFTRIQDLNRHIRDVHGPRRRCPFCDFQWTRPDKIKTHIVTDHWDIFTPELLGDIRGLRGQQIVTFVDDILLFLRSAVRHPVCMYKQAFPLYP